MGKINTKGIISEAKPGGNDSVPWLFPIPVQGFQPYVSYEAVGPCHNNITYKTYPLLSHCPQRQPAPSPQTETRGLTETSLDRDWHTGWPRRHGTTGHCVAVKPEGSRGGRTCSRELGQDRAVPAVLSARQLDVGVGADRHSITPTRSG